MPSHEDLENWLLAVAQDADRQAFARLFEHFAPRIKGFMLRGGCTADLAEEIAQEALVAVWRKAAQFRPGQAGVSTWVFTIARNLRIDLHRRRAGVPSHAVDVEDLPEHPADASDQPDEQAWSAQRCRRVREAMMRLPDEQAEVVRLSFFDDHPHAEIARALGIPLGTVKSRMRLAVGQLRKFLGEFE